MAKISELKSNIGQLLQEKYQLRSALAALYDDCLARGKPTGVKTMRDASKALRDTTFMKITARSRKRTTQTPG